MNDLILLVEDDMSLGKILKDFFQNNGLSVIWSVDGENALVRFKELRPRLVLLDVVLPGIDGFGVAAEIRKINGVVPIIFMTGTAFDIENYHKAYRLLRATNYIEKPVNPHNALAQIMSMLEPAGIRKFTISNLHIVIDGQQLTINHKNFQLRDKETQVLSLLLENINFTVSRNDILNKVWKDDKFQMNNALDRSVSHIKKILKEFPSISITTIYGSGYQMKIKDDKKNRRLSQAPGSVFL
ncbi:response regulator transcription factor [Proteiniphilum sp. UBA1028]|jgi:DNA-binding response OmpR family regulator|uniref:response regulator transcription factor n=1 Tax=Proteiniphilum sp. UBA1028 TaxID=1947251 RepID=UPI0025F591FD|nr:response regulator transcription factor [Proteiniphilum sp. UBA1028]